MMVCVAKNNLKSVKAGDILGPFGQRYTDFGHI